MKRYGVKPLVRIASYAWSACEPEIMGIGPVVSVKRALEGIGKTVGDMDLIEVNEVSLRHRASCAARSRGVCTCVCVCVDPTSCEGLQQMCIGADEPLLQAFAAQWLAVQKELELPDEKTNVFGGAIALGHPLAASGAR